MDPKKLSDTDLFSAFKSYGKQARISTRKSAGFLPELARRGLHRKRKCGSIYELAAKHAMLSRKSVDKVLRLDRQFEKMPRLRALLENGEVGWSKLEVVAGMATIATEEALAIQVKKMPKSGLVQWVRELKRQQMAGRVAGRSEGGGMARRVGERSGQRMAGQVDDLAGTLPNDHSAGGMFNLKELEGEVKAGEQSGLRRPVGQGEAGGLPEVELGGTSEAFASDWSTLSFKISPQNELKLRQLKQQLEKERKETLTFNEVIGALFDRMTVENESVEIELCPDCVRDRANETSKNQPVSRHLPTEVRRVITARSGGGCEFPHCRRPGAIFHHTRRFALKRNHDPNFIVFLCEAHERVAQSNLIEHEEDTPAAWQFREKAPWWDLKTVIDEQVAGYRRE